MTPIASVVIPAHNEQDSVGETLDVLRSGLPAGALEVIVVCNGCTDDTAAVASAHKDVRVIEVAQASKIAALRAGDAEATCFPRVYQDADVRIQGEAVRALADALASPRPQVAGLNADTDTSRSTWLVRRFFEFRLRLPVLQGGIIGAGVYALNEAGRARFEEWPEVTGDDQFVFRLFAPHERNLVGGHRSLVHAPVDLPSLVRRGVRVRRGNVALTAGAGGQVLPAPSSGVGQALRGCVTRPRSWPAAVTWVAVSAWIRLNCAVGGKGDWAEHRRQRAR